jgi:hypothetical protein
MTTFSKLWKGKLISWLMIFSITISVLAGCSGGGDAAAPTPAPVTPKAETVPFSPETASPLVKGVVMDVADWLWQKVSDTVIEGAAHKIGEQTGGKVLSWAEDILFGNSDAVKMAEITVKLDGLKAELDKITGNITTLSGQISLSTVTIENAIITGVMTPIISDVYVAYDGNDINGIVGLNAAIQKNTYTADGVMNGYIHDYAASPNNKTLMMKDIKSINSVILPSPVGDDGALMMYVKELLYKKMLLPPKKDPLGNTLTLEQTMIKLDYTDSITDANTEYKMLENYFAHFLVLQAKALYVYTEATNSYDTELAMAACTKTQKPADCPTYDVNNKIIQPWPTTFGHNVSAYLNGNYRQFIQSEVAEFLKAVDYLRANAVDYRTVGKFRHDSQFLAQGIATDDIYSAIFTRSRFFANRTLSTLSSLEDLPAADRVDPTNYGVVGSMVVPTYYSPDTITGAATPVGNISVQISGPGVDKTVIATPTNRISRYPYTRWNNVTKTSSPDYNLSFYDFNFGTLPAGTYTLTLVDGGLSNNPWYHTSTNLGTVCVKYYDPDRFDSTAGSEVPTSTNTVLYGFVSGRWDWGYSRLSSSPLSEWIIPTTKYYNEMGQNASNPTYKSYTKNDVAVEPPKNGTDSIVGSFEILLGPTKISTALSGNFVGYEIDLPIIIGADTNNNSAPNFAKLFFNAHVAAANDITGGTFNWIMCDIIYGIYDTKSKKSTNILAWNATDEAPTNYKHYQSDTPYSMFGSNFVPNQVYNFTIDGKINMAHKLGQKPTVETKLSTDWHAQVVYTYTTPLLDDTSTAKRYEK